MERTDTPHLDIEITEENLREGVAKIAQVLRPRWKNKTDQIQMKDKSTGFINRNYHCFIANDGEPFFLRIISTSLIPGLVERAQNAMRYLKRRRLGAQLLLTFTNGLVMEFIKGEPITWNNIDRVKEPAIWQSMARQMAQFHATTDEEDMKKFNIPTHEQAMVMIETMLRSSLANGKITTQQMKDLPTADQIFEWARMIYQKLIDAGAETKFCHMDPNPTNLIIKDDKSAVYVDYDDCLIDLPCLQIAGAFVDLCGINDFSLDKLPSEKEQDQFLREYLKTRHQLEGKGQVSEKTVAFWKFLLRKAQLHILLDYISVVLLLQSDITDKPVDLQMAHTCWQRYKNDKDKVLAETF